MAATAKTPQSQNHPDRTVVELDPARKTILIYSPDLNFGFSMSMLLQDRFNVVTTTSVASLTDLVLENHADLVLVDAFPSVSLLERLDTLKERRPGLRVILFYVFEQKSAEMERRARAHVDSVFYKPLDVAAVSRRVQEILLPA